MRVPRVYGELADVSAKPAIKGIVGASTFRGGGLCQRLRATEASGYPIYLIFCYRALL